ncbi:MAG: hypothetical protein ACR2P1_04795 [Pseudomonadales bacterium]
MPIRRQAMPGASALLDVSLAVIMLPCCWGVVYVQRIDSKTLRYTTLPFAYG